MSLSIGFLTSPMGILIIAIVILIASLVLMYYKVEWFRKAVDSVINPIKNFITRLIQGKVSAKELGEKIGWLIVQFSKFTNPIYLVYFAFTKLKNLWPQVKQGLSKIGQAVKDEFSNIPAKIRAGLGAAWAAARDFARGLVKGFLAGLDKHSPGLIQRESLDEFNTTLNRIAGLENRAVSVGAGFGSALTAGVISSAGGLSGDLTRSSISNHRGTMTHEIVHDLRNVPAGTDEERIAMMINSSENNILVKTIAKNSVFQEFDSSVKRNDRLSLDRSLGI